MQVLPLPFFRSSRFVSRSFTDNFVVIFAVVSFFFSLPHSGSPYTLQWSACLDLAVDAYIPSSLTIKVMSSHVVLTRLPETRRTFSTIPPLLYQVCIHMLSWHACLKPGELFRPFPPYYIRSVYTCCPEKLAWNQTNVFNHYLLTI